MSSDLHELLSERADSVEPPAFDPWRVVAQGERLVRRRRRLALASASLAVVVLGAVSALALGSGDPRSQPPEPAAPVQPHGTRPIAYGQGQVLHLGDRELDTGLDFLSLDLTDDGVALTTLDGGIWFSDGRTVERVGSTLGAQEWRSDVVTWHVGRPRDWVVGDTHGSLLAWLEYPSGSTAHPELVVFDAARRAGLWRGPVDGSSVSVLAIVDRHVFLERSPSSSASGLVRLDVDTGSQEPVDAATVEAARRGQARALVVGPSAAEGRLMSWETFRGETTTTGALPVRDSHVQGVFDPRTGEEVPLLVPGAADDGVWFVGWLDDDHFTLIGSHREYERQILTFGVPNGDLMICSISDGRCDTAVDASDWTAPPLLPGDGGLGAEQALRSAVQAAPFAGEGS